MVNGVWCSEVWCGVNNWSSGIDGWVWLGGDEVFCDVGNA